jgi:hypothetical protein
VDEMETVQVKCPVTEDNPTGYYVINKEDFDEGKHELYVEPKAEAEAAAKTAESKKK